MRGAVLLAVLRNPGLRRLAAGFVVFSMAEHATWIAILVFAYGQGGATASGLVAVAMLVPAAVAAPFAATLADRLPRQRVVVAAYAVQAVAMVATAAALVGGAPVLIAYATAVVASTSIVLTRPAQGALLPHLAGNPAELTASNVLVSAIEGVAILVGPASAGIIMAVSGPGMVFAIFGALLALSALLMIGLHDRDPMPAGPASMRAELDAVADTESALLEGFRTLAAQRAPRLVVLVIASAWVLWGAIDIFTVMLAIDLLGLGAGGAGFLVSAIGAGGLLGSVAAFTLVGRRRLSVPLLAGLALWGLPLAAVGMAPQPVLVFVFVTFAGAQRSILDAAGRTLLQRVSSDDVLARILGVLEGLQMAALAVGSLAAPLLVSAAGPRGALFAAGLVLPAVAVFAWRGLRAIDTGITAPDEWISAVRAVPMFAPLAPAVVEQLAGGAAAWTAAAGTVIIRQGDVGDRFHLILAGEVEVTVDGRPVRREGPGESFGEIALLRESRRTATVTAIRDTELLSLAREPFLLALTGHRSSRRVAERIADQRLGADSDGR
jgi:predicted MFS family arabinose efflux permease